MLKLIPKEKHKKYESHSGIESYFHFSFENYYSPAKMEFGVLKALNDYTIAPGSGIAPSTCQNVEVISYIYEGTLTHINSLNHMANHPRGTLKYLSSGQGLIHSERNLTLENLKMVTFWIIPNTFNTKPSYESLYISPSKRINQITKLIGNDDHSLLNIKQDLELYVCDSTANQNYVFVIMTNRQAYIVCLKGSININESILKEHDAATIVKGSLSITSLQDSTFIIVEMHQSLDYRELNKLTN
jgi:redox-sensitive bicupin YhaK (pirin superfamily)